MTEATIDRLQIQIEAEASKGSEGLDKFIASIERLKNLTSGGVSGLSNVAKKFKELNDSISGLKGKAATINALSKSFERLNDLDISKTSRQLSDLRKAVDPLRSVSEGVKDVAESLHTLSSKNFKTGNLQLDVIKEQAAFAAAQAKIEAAALRSARAQAGMEALKQKQLQLADAAKETAHRFDDLDDVIKRTLENERKVLRGGFYQGGTAPLGKSGMATPVEPLSDFLSDKTPIDEYMKSLEYLDVKAKEAGKAGKESFSQTHKEVKTTSLATIDLGREVQELKSNFKGIGSAGRSNMDEVTASVKRTAKETDRAAKSMRDLRKETKVKSGSGGLFGLGKAASITAIVYALKKGADAIGGFVSKTNDYIESMNLFSVSMGRFAKEAETYAMKFQTILGFDAGEAMRYMGVLQQLGASFGIAGNRALILSKNLTGLTYDFASFYNMKPEEAFTKLQAAISGEIEPIRRLGIDISAARLQQELYALGIDRTVGSLNQADKAQLRYITLMKQVGQVSGDAARTITSPANALRVLQAQLQVTARAIGSIFIPALNAIIPYAIQVVQVIGGLASRLAAFLGFKMPEIPEIDLSLPDIGGGLDDVTNGLDEVGEAAKKAEKQVSFLISGFDELNIVPQKVKDDAGELDQMGGVLDDVVLPGYDPFEGLEQAGSNVDDIVQKIIDALKRLKDALMDLGLREVLDNFKNFFKALKEQIDQYDFATAIKDALLNGFELAMSLLNLGQRLVFPIILALDVPGIVYEAINTLSALFSALNDIVRAVTPGLEKFVQIGLVPIAEWLGDKIRDGLKFLQEQFQKIGDWFTSHTDMFTDFGEAAGELVNALWLVIEPLLDSAWETFKDLVSGAVDAVLKLTELIIKSLTPALKKIAEWIKKNQKPLTMLLDFVLTTLIEIAAVKGIKKVFDGLVSGVKGFLKIMDGASLKILGLSDEINKFASKGAMYKLKDVFSQLKTNVVQSFKDMGYALSEFAKSVWKFVQANPWAVIITAVLALASAIAVTLYNDYKRTVQQMEENNMKKAFEGVPVSIEAVQKAMQGVVEKYDVLNQKVSEHQSAMQTLKSEYENLTNSLNDSFESLETGSGDAQVAMENLGSNLLNLSSNIKSQVDTDGQYFYNTWSDIFSNTSVLTEEREGEILGSIMEGINKRKGEIDSLQGEISNLLAGYREAEVNGEKEKMVEIQGELRKHYEELAKINEQEQARQAEISKQRQFLLAREILEGRQIITQENYKELLGQIESDEKTARDAVIGYQAEVRANLEANHKAEMDRLSKQKNAQLDIEAEIKNYNDSLAALNENYTNSLQDIAAESITAKTVLNQGFNETSQGALNVQKEFTNIKSRLEELQQYVAGATSPFSSSYFDTTNINSAKTEIENLQQQLQTLANENPEMFKRNWLGQFDFTANEAVNATKDIQGAIQESIDVSARYAATEGGTISSNLLGSLKDDVTGRLKEIGDAIGPAATPMINAFQQTGLDSLKGLGNGLSDEATLKELKDDVTKVTGTDEGTGDNGIIGTAKSNLETHSPSKVFEGMGKDSVLGLAEGFKDDTAINTVGTAIDNLTNSVTEKMETALMGESKTGVFNEFGLTMMQGFADGITNNMQIPAEALTTASTTILDSFKGTFEITDISGLFVTFGLYLMQGMAAGIKENVPLVTDELDALGAAVNEDYTAFMNEFKSSFTDDLQDLRNEYANAMSELSTATSDAMNGMESAVSSAVTSISRDLDDLTDDIDDTIDKLRELSRAQSRYGGRGTSGGRDDDGEYLRSGRVATTYAQPAASYGIMPMTASDPPSFAATESVVGTYQKSRSAKPENQGDIQEAAEEANAKLVQSMYQMTQMMIQAFSRGQNVSVQIDGREIGRASADYLREEERRTGKNPGKL